MKRVLRGFAAVALAAACGVVLAQQYPSRTITFSSAMAAGATTDVMARDIAKQLSERLGQAVVVDANAGGGGLVATQRVVNAPADGYTYLFGTNSLIANQAMRNKPEVDMAKDLVAVSPVFQGTFGMYINPDVPAKNVQEFIAWAKARPGKVNYGSSGVGSIVHLITEDFKIRAGLDMVHVPYKGGAEYLPATVTNQVQVSFLDVTFAQPQADAGKVRLLGVTSKQRLPQLPNVPTIDESGLKGYTPSFWIGMYAPRATPSAVVERVNGELRAILTPAEAKLRYAARGYQTIWLPPAEAQRMVVDELALLNKTVDTAKIQRE